jgi:ATP adenylyltransferase
VISAAIVEAAVSRALAGGALQPIATQAALIEDAGVRFVVRCASTLVAKALERRPDPLGDYEPALFVADLPPGHYLLLNKYPVRDEHLLVVTRRFEQQETVLSAADFAALAAVLGELDWLAFYNGGVEAGASQERKHLQLVPLPLATESAAPVPMEPLLASGKAPFRHAYARLAGVGDLHAAYRRLLAACAIQVLGDARQSAPYNMLATRRWMAVVPRRRERYESISVNALGFAGSLFVASGAELELVRRAGPMDVLRAVGLELAA